MSKFAIINLIDKVFISVSIFLIIFAWINFYTRNLWISFILGLIFSFACVFLLYYFLGKKKEKLSLNKKENDNINKIFLAFRLMQNNEQLNFLKQCLNPFRVEIKNNVLLYEKNNVKHAIILVCSLNILCENDFINIVQQTKNLDATEFEIICNCCENFSTKILKNKNYKITTKFEFVKKYFLQTNTIPCCDEIDTSVGKTRFQDILNRLFLPHKAKPYFWCGLILIFSSVIIPYHAYYIVFGSMLMLFAIICKIKKFYVV